MSRLVDSTALKLLRDESLNIINENLQDHVFLYFEYKLKESIEQSKLDVQVEDEHILAIKTFSTTVIDNDASIEADDERLQIYIKQLAMKLFTLKIKEVNVWSNDETQSICAAIKKDSPLLVDLVQTVATCSMRMGRMAKNLNINSMDDVNKEHAIDFVSFIQQVFVYSEQRFKHKGFLLDNDPNIPIPIKLTYHQNAIEIIQNSIRLALFDISELDVVCKETWNDSNMNIETMDSKTEKIMQLSHNSIELCHKMFSEMSSLLTSIYDKIDTHNIANEDRLIRSQTNIQNSIQAHLDETNNKVNNLNTHVGRYINDQMETVKKKQGADMNKNREVLNKMTTFVSEQIEDFDKKVNILSSDVLSTNTTVLKIETDFDRLQIENEELKRKLSFDEQQRLDWDRLCYTREQEFQKICNAREIGLQEMYRKCEELRQDACIKRDIEFEKMCTIREQTFAETCKELMKVQFPLPNLDIVTQLPLVEEKMEDVLRSFINDVVDDDDDDESIKKI